ncbi:MAG TPA: protein kinase [Chloroflexia bacterium]|nr:protein kinase [Chloroflexia bacterium]
MPIPAGFDPTRLLKETIGGYQLQEVLGTGNAVVYRALDPRKGEHVAFKLISWPGAPLDETTLRRFKREIDLLRRRRHPAIIDIYDWHTSGDYVYMAMECCDGTLDRWLASQRRERPKLIDVLRIAEPLASALDFLHEGEPPVLHRDIKPANILFKGNSWYISDFGIARMEADPLATSDGTLLGTLRYAAPEQMMGGKLTAATDTYSFGLVVYEMLAGSWVLGPRREGGAYDVPPLSRMRRGLGSAVDELFQRWLAADPGARPARASDAVRELAASAGILRVPALSRLYDLATEMAARPRDPAAWAGAGDILGTIAMHEPAFSDPRGLAAELKRRLAGESPGPQPQGYTGTQEAEFYSERTLVAGDPAGLPDAEPPDDSTPTSRKLRPPADLDGALFTPRTRYDADCTLVVPAESRINGSVFGRHVVLEPGARVDGDVYSLGDLTLGATAEVSGMALAGGTLETARAAQVGSTGIQAETVHLGKGAKIRGPVTAGGTLIADGGSDLGGVLAGGAVTLSGDVRVGAPAIGSATGTIALEQLATLGGVPAGEESIHPWSGGGAAPGQALTGLLTRRGRTLAQEALAAGDTRPALAAPRPVDTATETGLPAAPATSGPTLYLPAAFRLDGAGAPPAGLAADDPNWEAPLAAAALLDTVWRDFLAGLRVPAVCAAVLTLICWSAALWFGLAGQWGTSGLLIVGWLLVLAIAGGMIWLLRPRPRELVRLWWAWETWTVDGGVLLWDTLHAGDGPGYLDPETSLEPLRETGAALAAPDLSDTDVLVRLADLQAAITGLGWKSWPAVFAPRPSAFPSEDAPGVPSAPLELLHLPVEVPAPDSLPAMQVLAPRLDPAQVRAGAERLAGWPAFQGQAREVARGLEGDLNTLEPVLDRWEAVAAAATEGHATTLAAWMTMQQRATALATETLAALEKEIAPDLDRAWELHVAGTKLLGAYYEQQRAALEAAAAREQDRAAQRAAAAGRELRRQESALADIEAELRPVAAEWEALTATHDRLGSDLRRAWKAARAAATRNDDPGDLYFAPRPVHANQAAALLPQLAQDAKRLASQADELARGCAKDEQEIPAELPWPAWPARLEHPLDVDEAIANLSTLLRRVRNEPVRARARLDSLGSLRAKAANTLERVLGAQEALTAAVAGLATNGSTAEPGRLVSQKRDADHLVATVYPLLRDLARLQRRLEGATVAYDEVGDDLSRALKGGRTPPTWEQARRLQARASHLAQEEATTAAAAAEARNALATAQADQARATAEAGAMQEAASAAEKDLLVRSEEHAGREEAGLRVHLENIRERHAAVLATVATRQGWQEALAAFADECSDLKIRAVAHLADRIRLLNAFTAGRVDDTAAARAAVLWPADTWPAADMLYLLPVWLLRYQPIGRRASVRLLALTPGTVRTAPPAGRGRLLSGTRIEPLPGLAARFQSDVLAWANRRPGLADPLPGANLLAPGSPLAAGWERLAAAGRVAPWITRIFPPRRK